MSRSLLHSGLSTESAGWVASIATHLTGGLAVWMMAGTVPTTEPTLVGHATPVELTATWQEPLESEQFEEIPTIEAEVWIKPSEARVAEHALVFTDTGEPETVPDRVEPVERMVRLPSPAVEGIGAPTEQGIPAGDLAPPPRAARRRPPAPKVSVARVRIPRSAPDNPSVGKEMETDPHPMKNVPPSYPPQAVVNRWEGTAMLRVGITAEGNVISVEVASSSGHRILDVEAVRAVRKWQFTPAKRAGHPIAKTVQLPVQFLLDAE